MLIFGAACRGISRHPPSHTRLSPRPPDVRETPSRERGRGGHTRLYTAHEAHTHTAAPVDCVSSSRRSSCLCSLPLGFVGENIPVMSAFNLLHLMTKSQPVALRACGLPSGTKKKDKKTCKVLFTEQELRKRLTPKQYHVTQEKGTESAFTGEYTHHSAPGTYTCVVCGAILFKSEKKFDSNSGWPSFFDVVNPEALAYTDDFTYGMHRVETSCSQCCAHLGHIFDDGPRPTGKRYCINSASLNFIPESPGGPEGSGSSAVSPKTEL